MGLVQIILASASPQRKKLLKSLGLDFKVIPSKVDETLYKKTIRDPNDLVKKLACKKAEKVAKQISKKNDFLVIGADSIAALLTKKGWFFLDKPKNKWQARKTTQILKGKCHTLFTALCVIDNKNKQKNAVVKSKVYFNNFSQDVLHRFVESGIWKDKAGGYDISENKPLAFIKKYEGSYTNILGLPLEKLISILSQFGVKIDKNRKGGDNIGKKNKI